MEWQFRRSHYGLFLQFGILFWFHSMTFWRVIINSWCSVSNSRLAKSNLISFVAVVPTGPCISVNRYEFDIDADLLLTAILETTTRIWISKCILKLQSPAQAFDRSTKEASYSSWYVTVITIPNQRSRT
jgi:hypothetical protein